MRYAIVSDIHANKFAFEAVLEEIKKADVDQIICLGDLVGYGPDPQAVMEMCYENVHQYVLGNHDAVICGKLDPEIFNDSAKKMINWTRERLDETAIDFFNSAPYIVHEDGFSFVHSEMIQPDWFGYIDSLEIAMESLDECEAPVIFAGHTHVLRVFCRDSNGNAYEMTPQDFKAEPGKRYVVTVGAVGFPRGNGLSTTYTIFDNETGEVNFHHLPFEVERYRDRCNELNMDTNSPSYRFLHLESFTGQDVIQAQEQAHEQAVQENKVVLGQAPVKLGAPQQKVQLGAAQPALKLGTPSVAAAPAPQPHAPPAPAQERSKHELLLYASTAVILLLLLIIIIML